MAGLLYRLGRFSARRHWLVIITWIVVMGIAGGTYALFAGTISSSITIPGTKTSQVQDELADKFPSANGGTGTLVFTTKDGAAFSDAQKTGVADFLKDVEQLNGRQGRRRAGSTPRSSSTTSGRSSSTAGSRSRDGRAQLTQQQAQLDAGQAADHAGPAAARRAEAAGLRAAGAAAEAAQQQLAAAQSAARREARPS